MGSDCGCRLVSEEPLLPAAVPPLLLDEVVRVVDTFSLPFVILLLDPGIDVEADANWGGGDGGRAPGLHLRRVGGRAGVSEDRGLGRSALRDLSQLISPR